MSLFYMLIHAKGLYTLVIFAHNISIKRSKEIDNFEPWVSMTNQDKLLKINSRYVRVFKSLPQLVNRNLCLKIIKYKNNFLSQHCGQKYLVCTGPKLVNDFQSFQFLFSPFRLDKRTCLNVCLVDQTFKGNQAVFSKKELLKDQI